MCVIIRPIKKERKRKNMKKKVLKITSIMLLIAFLSIGVSATYNLTYDNYNDPHIIQLPNTTLYGGNKAGLYVSLELHPYEAVQNSKYKWELLSDDDAGATCRSLRFNVTNKIAAITGLTPELSQVTAQFYGYNMTTSVYKTISENSVYTSNEIDSCGFSFSTIIRNPQTQAVVKSDLFTKDYE